jgi:hypothetical protein
VKLITPVSLLIATALLAIYTAFAFQIALIERSWPLAVAGAIATVACIATALMKPWSQYLVYLVTVGFVGKWGWSIFDSIRSGYFGIQFGSSRTAILSVAPSLLMAGLSCICAWLVYRHFHSLRPAHKSPELP